MNPIWKTLVLGLHEAIKLITWQQHIVPPVACGLQGIFVFCPFVLSPTAVPLAKGRLIVRRERGGHMGSRAAKLQCFACIWLSGPGLLVAASGKEAAERPGLYSRPPCPRQPESQGRGEPAGAGHRLRWWEAKKNTSAFCRGNSSGEVLLGRGAGREEGKGEAWFVGPC